MDRFVLENLKRNLGGFRVLIMEDDKLFQKLLKKVLEVIGVSIIEWAHDGNVGYMKSRTGSYDLIITDFDMPGLVGTEVIKKIHADNPNQVFILMTRHDVLKSVRDFCHVTDNVHLIGKHLFRDCLGGENQQEFWNLFADACRHASRTVKYG